MKISEASLFILFASAGTPAAYAQKNPILRGPALLKTDAGSSALSLIMAQMEKMAAKLEAAEVKLEATEAQLSKLSKCFDVEELEDGSTTALIKDGCSTRSHGDHVIHGSVHVHGDQTTNGHHTVNGHHIVQNGNIYVHDGSGSPMCTHAKSGDATLPKCTGKGNIFVGHAPGDEASVHRDITGSHNIILGTAHNVTSHGAIVSGFNHTSAGPHASAIGGKSNTAMGYGSLALGGSSNVAGKEADDYACIGPGSKMNDGWCFVDAVVLGGSMNKATGWHSSVTGGNGNIAGGAGSTVAGGVANHASGPYSTVSGGKENTASAVTSLVAGGSRNVAAGGVPSVDGASNSVFGGSRNENYGAYSALVGECGLKNNVSLSWDCDSTSD
ncbi:hypothetical protein ACHAWF_009331 [Thalassiosira exigua]